MDEMRIKSKFLTGIITKALKRYFSKKFNANNMSITIQDLNVSMEKGVGEFSVIAHGSFTQEDIYNLTKEFLSE